MCKMSRFNFVKIFSLCASICWLSACTTLSPPVEERIEVEDKSQEVEPPEDVAPVIPDQQTDTLEGFEQDRLDTADPGKTVQTLPDKETSPAIVALLSDADKFAMSGKTEQAAARLERAIRIEPNNALLWQKLGKIRLEQKKWHLAISMAQKSNSLAASDNYLQSENWLIISYAKDGLGDREGAIDAREKAKSLHP